MPKKATELLTCGKAPCKSCPYRQDVPSGLWEREEYEKLLTYDGPTWAQSPKVFMCHQQDGKLCAGWVGTHGPEELLALRLHPADESVYSFESPVPLFASGAEAAQHGLLQIHNPPPQAKRLIARLEIQRARRSAQS